MSMLNIGLISADIPSSEYFELANIYKQEGKVKEKLNLLQNGLIRYEKARCSKYCKHNTHHTNITMHLFGILVLRN
jgi:hypothetical protein